MDLVDSQGRLSGIMIVNSCQVPDSFGESYEVVAISKGRCFFKSDFQFDLEELYGLEYLLQLTKLRGPNVYKTLDSEQTRVSEHYARTGEVPSDSDGTLRYKYWNTLEVYEWYNVLWIEWKDGIAYRKGLGRVSKEAWESMDLEAVDVLLG
jgi:hypothetical protein